MTSLTLNSTSPVFPVNKGNHQRQNVAGNADVSTNLPGTGAFTEHPGLSPSSAQAWSGSQHSSFSTARTITALHAQHLNFSRELADSGFTGSGLTGSGLTGSGLTGSGLTGSGLTGSGLTGSGFTGSGALYSGQDPNVSATLTASAPFLLQHPNNVSMMGLTDWGLHNHHHRPNNVSLTEEGVGEEEWGHLSFLLTSPCCVQIVLFLVMVAACSLLGTLGNIPVLLVYCSRKDRRTSTTFIKALAIIDLLVCAVIMPYTVVMELHLVTSDLVCRLFEFLRHVSITASNLTLVAIAIERYVAVCRIRQRLTVDNVKQGMGIVVGTSMLVAVPSLGLFKLSTREEVAAVPCAFPHRFHSQFAFCHFNTAFLGPVLSTAYQTALMLLFFLSVLVIVVIYAVVYSFLWKRAKRRSISQPLKSDVEVSSCGERRRPRVPSSPGNELSPPEHPPHDDYRPCPSSEAVDCSSEEQMSRLAASGELSVWPLPGEDLPSTAESLQGRGGVQSPRFSMHRRTARMLFLCTVVFLVTWLPFWVDVFSLSHNLCLRYMFFVGNATNPVVYGIANSHFRRSFVRLIVHLKGQCTPSKHS